MLSNVGLQFRIVWMWVAPFCLNVHFQLIYWW